ncbi:Subtilisin-like protease SBT1.9 [Rhynchospora pubera]|uniref:Subtilisin-like protease SBT1.9 n=1 Tax=Rhynchospora pubera TaxID=906938 RepID=A0AAV8BX60_9POAL|nr:Subtilisin-like protease SBT1.9 [Rhynchospora pubera]
MELLIPLITYAITILPALRCAVADSAMHIVYVDKSFMPKVFSSHHDWYSSMLVTTSDTSDPVTDLMYVYDNVAHGFAARLSQSQLSHLETTPGVLSYQADMPVKPDTTYTPKFLGLDSGIGLWPASGRGEDVIIGVVDTGVWPESASFNDTGFSPVPKRWHGACETGPGFGSSSCNNKLIGARAFNKGLLANNPNLTLSNTTPRDTDGHGTHTSSTAGGSPVSGASFFGYSQGTASGIAPQARVAMYKALWDEGAYTSDILAAIDQAVYDGVDVISLSLGIDGLPFYKDPVAIASYAAMEQGIIVVASSGNEGPDLGLLHNGTPWLTTVAATTVNRVFSGVVRLGDGSSINGESIYLGKPVVVKNLPLKFMGNCTDKKNLKETRHSIVVCEVKKYIGLATQTVKAAKVDASLFITDDIFSELFVRFSFPGVLITPQDGATLLDYINNSSNPTATLHFRQTILGVGPAPQVATYSSRGPSASSPNVLKPDISAPGSLIFASWSQNSTVGSDGSHELYSPFNIISGTSMSCPHVSGLAALLRAARPEWTPAMIRSAMMTTASSLDNTMEPIKDIGTKGHPATPLAMGSGQIEPNKALDPGLVYDAGPKDYIKFLCASNFTYDQIKIITHLSSVDCSGASRDLNYPSFIAFFEGKNTSSLTDRAVKVFRRTVTNVGDNEATYSAIVKGVKGLLITVKPDKLVFTKKHEKQSFEVRIEGQIRNRKEEVVHGSLTWVDDKGNHEVRSPIVATTFSGYAL